MQKKCNKRLGLEINKFKTGLKQKLIELGVVQIGNPSSLCCSSNQDNDTMMEISKDLLKYINDFKPESFVAEDFKRRQRVKNIVPMHERCIALRADHQQCTRRKRNGEDFCGTHIKGIPHGKKDNKNTVATKKKINVWTQDIQGIIYYVDDNNNVYDPADVMNNKVDPGIIAKYISNNGNYSIEKFL